MHANLHINAISRSQGRSGVAASAYRSGTSVSSTSRRSVVAAAAYRAGERLTDEKADKTFDYTRKHHVEAQAMLVPEQAKDWARDRQSYWNAVEDREKRKDALLAKEALLVLPRNLSKEQRKEVVENWANEHLVQQRNLVVDYAIHAPSATDGDKNYHAHVLYYPRPIEANGEFAAKKLTGYKTPNTVDGTKVLEEFRFSYQDYLNKASAQNDNEQGKVIRFDLRSYKEKGVNRIPQWSNHHNVNAVERKGKETKRGKAMKRMMAINKSRAGRERYVQTFAPFGGGNKKHAGLSEKARQDVANTYYDVMYGDGSEGSFDKENDLGYGR